MICGAYDGLLPRLAEKKRLHVPPLPPVVFSFLGLFFHCLLFGAWKHTRSIIRSNSVSRSLGSVSFSDLKSDYNVYCACTRVKSSSLDLYLDCVVSHFLFFCIFCLAFALIREVAAFGRDTCEAFLQALVATGFQLPSVKVSCAIKSIVIPVFSLDGSLENESRNGSGVGLLRPLFVLPISDSAAFGIFA